MPIRAVTTTVAEYIDVRGKIAQLGCRNPEGMALLPINLESAASMAELLQASEAATIRKLLVAEGIPLDDILDRRRRPPYVKNKSFEWVAPGLFVSASLYSQNPALVSVALGVVANYATDFFKGMSGEHEVSLNIIVERKNRTYRKVSYLGPVEGLKELAEIIREAAE
jgi:hypothetical protein